MSILPSFATINVPLSSSKEIPAEYGIDFSTGQLTGKKVYGVEAIKVWIWLCLHTERFRYQLYSQSYGVEFEQYIGQTVTEDFLFMDAQNVVMRALMVNKNITEINNFEISVDKNKFHLQFTVMTPFGKGEMQVNV